MGAPGTSRGTRGRDGLWVVSLEDDWVRLRDLGSLQGKEIFTIFICSFLQVYLLGLRVLASSNLLGFLLNLSVSLLDDAMPSEGRQMSDLASVHHPIHLHRPCLLRRLL